MALMSAGVKKREEELGGVEVKTGTKTQNKGRL